VLSEVGTFVLTHVGDTYLIFIYIKYCAFGWCNKLDTLTKITVCLLVYWTHILCHECRSSGSQWISPQRPVQFCGWQNGKGASCTLNTLFFLVVLFHQGSILIFHSFAA